MNNDKFIKSDPPIDFRTNSCSSSISHMEGDDRYNCSDWSRVNEDLHLQRHAFNAVSPCKCKRDNTHPNNRAENDKHIVYLFNGYTDYIFKDGWNPECSIHKDSEFSNPKTKDEMFGNTMEADYEREMELLHSNHKIFDFGSALRQFNKDNSLWVLGGILLILVIFIFLMLVYC